MYYVRINQNVSRYNQTHEVVCQAADTDKIDFDDVWKTIRSQQLEKKQDQLLNSLNQRFKNERMCALFVYLLYYQATIIVPLFAYYLFINMNNHEYSSALNTKLVAAIIIIKLIKPFLRVYAEEKLHTIGQKMYNILAKDVLTKSLKVSLLSNKQVTSSQLIKIMQVDLQKILPYPEIIVTAICNSYSTFFNIFLIVFLFGWAGLAGIGVFLINIFLRFAMRGKIDRYESQRARATGNRVQNSVDIFNIIKFIKVAALELPYFKKLVDLRKAELNIFNSLVQFAILPVIAVVASIRIVILTVCLILIMKGESFNAAVIFTLNYIFININFQNLIVFFASIKQVKVSLNNIDDFLKTQQMDTSHIKRNIVSAHVAISIQNGNFQWDTKADQQSQVRNRIQMKNIHLDVRRGQFISIIGKFGSGKSSLLQAILGQMKNIGGSKININGSIAYAGQKPWILNDTVRNNILFGALFDPQRYSDAIHFASLKPDLQVLAEGDQTMIGQRGCTLSGGQKARVAFARVLYANADILLLDDILSAVDAHVGAFIFFETLLKYCKGKTIALVTHNINYVQHTNKILVVDNCRVVANGTFEQLKNLPLLKEIQISQRKIGLSKQQDNNPLSNKLAPIEAEPSNRVIGGDDTLGHFMKHSGGRKFKALTILFISLLSFFYWLIGIEMNVWGNSPNYTQAIYIYLYLLLVVLITIATVLLFYFIMHSPILMNVYKDMVKGSLFASLSYFDNTPIAKVIHHLSSDLYLLDKIVLMEYFGFTVHVAIAFCYITSILYALIATKHLSLLIIFIVFLLLLFYKYNHYLEAVKAYRQAEDELKIPINSYYSELVQGQAVIRAFMKATQKQQGFQHLQRNYKNMRSTVKGIIVIINFFISFSSTLYLIYVVIYFLYTNTYSKFDIFVLINIFSMEEYLLRSNQNIIELLAKLKCLSRCEQLMNIPSQEGYRELLSNWDDDEKIFERASLIRALTPFSRGQIDFKRVSVCYKREYGDVLRDLSFKIRAGEKIGVIGRTGSGKSSLLLTLLRIIQPYKGSIMIDGMDCANMNLSSLRTNFNFILQEHFLFAGTVRSNIDTAGQHSDEQIIHVLGLCGLWEGLKCEEGLQKIITQGGENLSVGERQLLNISRALLNKRKIVLIDEATASIDSQTDAAIQKVLRTHFTDSTVLTIAHRLDSVYHCDRILVLQRGQVRQFDTPSNLLSKKDSLYRKLCQQTSGKSKND